MTWQDVARRDLRSVARSRLGPAVALLLLACTVGAVSLMAVLASPGYPPGMRDAVLVLGSVLSFAIPLAALLGSYSAIVGERTTGSVRFLLGLPNSRRDAYVGKFVSRSLVVLVPLGVGLLAAGFVVAATFDGGSFLGVVLLGLASVVYTLFFVGLGLTASTIAETDTQAVALAVGAYLLFRVAWPALQWVGVHAFDNPYPRPAWYFVLGRLNPLNSYIRATAVLADIEYHPLLTHPDEIQSVVLSVEFALVVLCVWALVAPVVGLVNFRDRDLL